MIKTRASSMKEPFSNVSSVAEIGYQDFFISFSISSLLKIFVITVTTKTVIVSVEKWMLEPGCSKSATWIVERAELWRSQAAHTGSNFTSLVLIFTSCCGCELGSQEEIVLFVYLVDCCVCKYAQRIHRSLQKETKKSENETSGLNKKCSGV